MSRPPLFPHQTASGIAVDPGTLERVIPESRRPDGSVRRQIKIRPGFTPQEDISRFRGTRQQAMDGAALPKGHILGWVAPSSGSQPRAPPPNKNAKKRASQRARKAAETSQAVKDSWEDDDDAESTGTGAHAPSPPRAPAADTDKGPKGEETEGTHSVEQPNWAVAADPADGEAEIADKLSKLRVK